MSLNDEPQAGEPPVEIPVDDQWQEQFAGQEDAGEDAPSVSGETIPSFPHYVVRFYPGKGGFTRTKNTPMSRNQAEVLEGPSGSVGERIFDDLFLRVSKTTQKDGVTIPKSAEDYRDNVEAFQKKLNKIARVGKFHMVTPVAPVQDALDGYAKQFAFDAIVEIRESTDTYQGVTRTRNRIIWESLRALDDPASSRKAKPGTTSLDWARMKIEEIDKATAARNTLAGRTAGGVSRKPGTLND